MFGSYMSQKKKELMAQELVELGFRLKGMNLAASKQSSILFFDTENRENVVSGWKWAVTLAAKVGKGLSKDNKAQLLVDKHWLEAIDPLHRYGENLKWYYDVWLNSHSSESFLYWLDIGDGNQIDLKERPRTELRRNCVRYLGPKEREQYEVIVENGKLVYKQNGAFVHTTEGMKWIFVLSTSRSMFVGQKDRGLFQHSSFLAGAAIVAAGRLVVSNGILQAIWSYSGHYRPTEENFEQIIRFLDEQQVDLKDVKMCSVDDDAPHVPVSKSDTTRASDPSGNNVPPTNIELSETRSASTEFVDHNAFCQ